ncbi:MAG: AbrB/MazE/SpoVT family DNA-binding domain-containing protein [Halobacteriales archaeon]|nr:AbrB/MazE/SpoVT family DNA-binding domain-containing protein [Halobacteriales archaeon]
MTDDSETPFAYPPAMFADQLQRAGEEFAAKQQEWFQQMMTGGAGGNGAIGDLTSMTAGAAVFKTRVQSGGRISIPDAEREALDIGDGDLVQAFVIPLRSGDHDE